MMKSPSRLPVTVEEYLMNTIGICWPYVNDKNIKFQLNILAEQLQDKIDAKQGRKKQREIKQDEGETTEQKDLRKFIALFRDRYAQETDTEYRSTFHPDEIASMKSIVKKLREKELDPEDYLSWVFDVFFDDNYNKEKFSPVVKFICGPFVSSRFFMLNRDKFRKKQESQERLNRREAVRQYGKKLFRKTHDEDIETMMRKEDEGTITTRYLEDWLKQREAEMEERGVEDE